MHFLRLHVFQETARTICERKYRPKRHYSNWKVLNTFKAGRRLHPHLRNIQQICILLTQCVTRFHATLRVNSDYLIKQR
jgi:hypothetical protein